MPKTNIDSRIQAARHHYLGRHAELPAPRKVLLGVIDAEELIESCNEHLGTQRAELGFGLNRIEYSGMKVYEVDEPNYIGFAP